MKNCRRQAGRGLLRCLLTVVVCLIRVGSASAGVKVDETITGEEAQQHLQATNTVCGTIMSAKYLENSKAKPTYLDFDRPYPDQTFAAVIPQAARAKFKDAPETAFKGKNVCVTGLITANTHGKPQIIVEDPAQIKINEVVPATGQTDAPPAK
jgi:hypothetical protein